MEPYRKLNTAYGAERGKLFEKVENYNIRGMGGEVEIKETPLKGIDVDYDTLDKIGFETAEKDLVLPRAAQFREILEEDLGLPFIDNERVLVYFDKITSGQEEYSSQI